MVPLRSAATAVPAAVLATALTLALVACSGDSDDGDAGDQTTGASVGDPTAAPSTTPSTTSPATGRDYSFDELAAALPTAGQLPDGFEVTEECREAAGADCDQEDGEVRTAHVVAGTENGDQPGDFLRISATANPSPDVAQTSLADSRADRTAEFDGPFDIPAEETDDGEIPGRRGQGHLGDTAIEGWTGYQLTMAYASVSAADELGATNAQHGFLVLASGNAEIEVEVRMHSGGTIDDTAQSRLDTWMRAVLDKLG